VDVASWLRSHRKQQYQSAFQGNTITPRYCETASGLKDPGTSGQASAQAARCDRSIPQRYWPSTIERPRLTVMFCELVGSITLAGILDPKDLHRVIASYPPRDGRYDGTVRESRGPRTWPTARIPATTSFELAVSGWRRSRGSDPATDEVRTLAIHPLSCRRGD
jgi:hypothetical protein